jgi:hypothetical protein
MTSFSNEEAFAELYYTVKAIKLVTGVTPTCWRAPFGDVDDRIRTIAHGLGLQHMMWEYDSVRLSSFACLLLPRFAVGLTTRLFARVAGRLEGWRQRRHPGPGPGELRQPLCQGVQRLVRHGRHHHVRRKHSFTRARLTKR